MRGVWPEVVGGHHKKAVVALYGQTSRMLLPIPLTNIALSFLNRLFPTHIAQHPHVRPPTGSALNFHLRHFHVATPSAHVYLADAPHDLSPTSGLASGPLSIITTPLRAVRPSSNDDFQAARHMSKRGQSAMLDWEENEVPGPDVTRRETLLLLAKMTSNTYFEPSNRGWYNLTDEWNVVRHPFPASRAGTLSVIFVVLADFEGRVCRLDGNPITTASGDTYSRRRTTALWCSPSRAHPSRSSAAGRR